MHIHPTHTDTHTLPYAKYILYIQTSSLGLSHGHYALVLFPFFASSPAQLTIKTLSLKIVECEMNWYNQNTQTTAWANFLNTLCCKGYTRFVEISKYESKETHILLIYQMQIAAYLLFGLFILLDFVARSKLIFL